MSQSVLLIQDDPSDAETVRDALARGGDDTFRVEWVRRCGDALRRLAMEREGEEATAGGIAAVLVDLVLPDSYGVESIDRLHRTWPHIPILVLTKSQHEDTARMAIRHGAQDYLLKDRLDGEVLPKLLRSIIDRAASTHALRQAVERAQCTLDSIGDAVICSDAMGNVTYLNAVAENMTGWSREQATGRPFTEVFLITDAITHQPVPNPMAVAIAENRIVSLSPNGVLTRPDGAETAIEDSAAPIHDREGRITGAVIVFRDVTMARATSIKMAYLAQHDDLTDLPNRVMFNDRLTHAMALARRHRQKLAVLYLDIDRFKHINDSLGHAIGDRLLQSVAQRLLDCVRSSDTVSRQGGDEFVILLSQVTHARDAAVLADAVLEALSRPHHIDQHDLYLTVSIGIVTYPDDGIDAEPLLQNADFAMYHAKECGRNNYQFFDSEMNALAIERQSIENGLRHAIGRHEFVLHYQPRIDLESGAIIGVEALIRWHHPQRGLVPPGQFIPIAEECGYIVQIGRWVLREACHQASKWRAAGLPALRLAVNISVVELCARDFVAGVQAILVETGMDPGCLELELTETFLMQDSKSTAMVLQSIKDMGVHLALDDFGTGYSSLSYLKRFPIDALKIDQSFVRDLTTDADDASIVSAVIGMGRNLHLQVVAEGVETREQLAFLKQHCCPEGQGYYFSRAVPAEDFARELVRSVAATAAVVTASVPADDPPRKQHPQHSSR